MARIEVEGLDEGGLRLLCKQRWLESELLDFKRTLPGKEDRGRRELLKDVCAFANAGGGDLLFGVTDKDGAADELAPIVEESSDDAILRLGQMIDAGIEPRLSGIRFKPVPVSTGGYVLLASIPASFDGPHRYLVNEASRFVMRSGRHTIDMTYQQLRSAFGTTATLAERAREFRSRRLVEIRQLPRLKAGPLAVVHVVPISAMMGASRSDITKIYNERAALMFDDWGSAQTTFNLDGVLKRTSDGISTFAYSLAFRSGALETVRWSGRTVDDQTIIPSKGIAAYIREAIRKLCAQCRALEMEGPAIVGVSLLNVGDWKLALDESYVSSIPDRGDLVFPESWVQDLEMAESDLDTIAKPILDLMWQSYGEPLCHYYERGVWVAKR